MAETIIGLFKTEVIRKRGPWRHLEGFPAFSDEGASSTPMKLLQYEDDAIVAKYARSARPRISAGQRERESHHCERPSSSNFQTVCRSSSFSLPGIPLQCGTTPTVSV